MAPPNPFAPGFFCRRHSATPESCRPPGTYDIGTARPEPIAFENPVSYLPPHPAEIPDGEFAAEVAEAADCGILLDLHNLLCNERNGRQSVAEYCRSIPLERVWEIHLAGGQLERGFWLDAHSGIVEPALLEIVAELVPRLPALRADI